MAHYECSVCGEVFCESAKCVQEKRNRHRSGLVEVVNRQYVYTQPETPVDWDKVLKEFAAPLPEPEAARALAAQLNFVRRGGEVERYHTARTLQTDTAGHHSFNVAWLVVMLSGAEICRGVLLMAALAHDLAEQRLGDMPAPAKRAMPAYPSEDSLLLGKSFRTVYGELEMDILGEHGMHYETLLTPEELRTLKLADALDGMLFCVEEASLGNRRVEEIFNNFRGYVESLCPVSAAETALYSYAVNQWSKYHG